MQTTLRILVIVLLLPAPASAGENPLTAHNRFMYGGLKAMLLSAAEKMPEEHYAFEPAETVRSFGDNAHNAEHYGNLVTYLRMKGLVPPTSDPEFRVPR